MASTPQWKCYLSGKYMAATKHPEDAAILMAAWGSSGEVRFDHKLVVWRETHEEISAGESADQAAAIMIKRREEWWAEAKKRAEGRIAQSWREIQEAAKKTVITVPNGE